MSPRLEAHPRREVAAEPNRGHARHDSIVRTGTSPGRARGRAKERLDEEGGCRRYPLWLLLLLAYGPGKTRFRLALCLRTPARCWCMHLGCRARDTQRVDQSPRESNSARQTQSNVHSEFFPWISAPQLPLRPVETPRRLDSQPTDRSVWQYLSGRRFFHGDQRNGYG